MNRIKNIFIFGLFYFIFISMSFGEALTTGDQIMFDKNNRPISQQNTSYGGSSDVNSNSSVGYADQYRQNNPSSAAIDNNQRPQPVKNRTPSMFHFYGGAGFNAAVVSSNFNNYFFLARGGFDFNLNVLYVALELITNFGATSESSSDSVVSVGGSIKVGTIFAQSRAAFYGLLSSEFQHYKNNNFDYVAFGFGFGLTFKIYRFINLFVENRTLFNVHSISKNDNPIDPLDHSMSAQISIGLDFKTL